MKSKAYFQYYETFETVTEKLPTLEQREHFRKSIINYGLHGEEPEEMDALEEMAWIICRELIDQQRHRREVNAENASGKRKTEPPKRPAPAPRMKRPTVEEVAAYCKDKGYDIDAGHFVSYYEANGWKVGKNPMKSWQATVTNWATRDKNTGKAAGTMWQKENNTNEYEDAFN